MLDKPRILLVEDNLVNQKIAVRMLTKLGYQVDVANNGQEAVDAWQNRPYAIILMDCLMPEMDGFQATRAIREQGETSRMSKALGGKEASSTFGGAANTKHVIIIALTANAMEGDREKCLEAGMNDFIPKPVNIKILGEVLAKWLSGENENVSQNLVGSSPSMVS